MTLKKDLFLLILFVTLLWGVFAVRDAFLNNEVSSQLDYAHVAWVEQIKKEGGERAYERFSKYVAHESESKKHEQAHIFGAALYTALGEEGLSVCDTQFSYGCFHEFLGRAIADLGIGSVSRLNESCFEAMGKSWLACQHGIGHGIQSYFGYKESDLHAALTSCSNLKRIDPIGGCYGGAFMEYNFQTMLGDQARVRKSDDIFSPCGGLSEKYLPGCVFSLPQWWHQYSIAYDHTPVSFRELGERCVLFTENDLELRQTCFNGIGNIAPQVARYEPRKTHALCQESSIDNRWRLSCLSNAANIIGITIGKEVGERVCAGLPDRSYSHCAAYARNEANALVDRELPQQL